MRVDFQGDAQPNPELVFPDPGSDDTFPPLTLVLPEGVFLPASYIAMGYTHYEVWCIGGAGGRGSDSGGRGYLINEDGSPAPFGSPAAGIAHLDLTWPYYFEEFPEDTQHWHDPRISQPECYGGGGGGGGLHVVSGLLAVLPDEVTVVVGQAGVDAPLAQNARPIDITPTIDDVPYSPGSVYDEPHLTFVPPESGEDGGASTFNGLTCRASGGKGGGPSGYWTGSPPRFVISGNGGAGGAGNRTTAGGGAVGATEPFNPPDGSWDGDIGKGGGGGRGGSNTPPLSGPGYGV